MISVLHIKGLHMLSVRSSPHDGLYKNILPVISTQFLETELGSCCFRQMKT